MPTAHPQLRSAPLICRIRAKAAARATARAEQALHDGQPLVAQGSELLCTGYLGDVRLDLYGTAHRLRSGVVVDLDDAAIAGTRISLRDSLTGEQWEQLQRQAAIAVGEL